MNDEGVIWMRKHTEDQKRRGMKRGRRGGGERTGILISSSMTVTALLKLPFLFSHHDVSVCYSYLPITSSHCIVVLCTIAVILVSDLIQRSFSCDWTFVPWTRVQVQPRASFF